MKALHVIGTLSVLLLFFSSCRRQEKNELIYSYSSFNAPVSCISNSTDRDAYFAGLENGNIVYVDVRRNENRTISTSLSSRIYKIIQENDTILWVGVRNRGVIKLRYSLKDNRAGIEKEYDIVIPERNDTTYTKSYAPYDMVMDTCGNLFMATSAGVYRLLSSEREKGRFTVLSRPVAHEKKHFETDQIKLLGNSIVCATENGLVILDKEREYQKNKPIINKKISHLYQINDTLYASSPSMLYKIFKKQNSFVQDSIPFRQGDLWAYVADLTAHGKWVFTSSEIRYSNNDGSVSPFHLPEKNNSSYRNTVCLGTDFLFFANGMKIYSFSLHQNPKGSSNNIVAACMHARTCFFITNDNYLYTYDSKENVRKWGSVGLEVEENILQMCSTDRSLWLITDKENFYQIDLTPGTIKNLFKRFRSPYIAKKSSLHDDFKSMYYHEMKNRLYLGSRNFLYVISDPEHRPINALKDKKDYQILDITYPKGDLYVTSICKNKSSSLLLGTLNYGLLSISESQDSLITKLSNAITGSIYRMTPTGEGVLLHTSKGLLFEKSNQTGIVCPANEDEIFQSTIVISDQNFNTEHQGYIDYKGVGSLTVKDSTISFGERSYLDIAFNKAAIVANSENSVLLGGKSGLYKYEYENDRKAPLSYILIPKDVITVEEIILLGCLILIVLVVISEFILELYSKKQLKRLSFRVERFSLDAIKEGERRDLADALVALKKRIRTMEHGGMINRMLHLKSYLLDIRDLEVCTDKLEAAIKTKRILLLHNESENSMNLKKELIERNRQEKELQEKINGLIRMISTELEKDKNVDVLKVLERSKGKTIYTLESSLKVLQEIMNIVLARGQELSKNIYFLERNINDFKKEKDNKIKEDTELISRIKDLNERIIGAMELCKSIYYNPIIEDLKSKPVETLKECLDISEQLVGVSLEVLEKANQRLWDKELLETMEQYFEEINQILEPQKGDEELDAETLKKNEKRIRKIVKDLFEDPKYEKDLKFAAKWSDFNKIVACMYLSKEEKITPYDIQICTGFSNKNIANARCAIHGYLEKIDDREGAIICKLYDVTKATK